ncbi:hypothetical protein SAY86_013809 [Trapa natans]|uniref:Uncharacterized protein n=1 Tax=Trapa natans TaxID=22666 RepID=A0AAN7KV86_TRANT|nr:hypothetical protein SAY86_013809 [Trapa natans]
MPTPPPWRSSPRSSSEREQEPGLSHLPGQARATTNVDLSDLGSGLFTARPGSEADRLCFVGEVARVDPSALRHLTDQGFIRVIASASMDWPQKSERISMAKKGSF